MTNWTPEEDEAFNEVEKHSNLGKQILKDIAQSEYKKNTVPMLEKFAAQSLVEHGGELIFSKEKFARLIVKECMEINKQELSFIALVTLSDRYDEHFGIDK